MQGACLISDGAARTLRLFRGLSGLRIEWLDGIARKVSLKGDDVTWSLAEHCGVPKSSVRFRSGPPPAPKGWRF